MYSLYLVESIAESSRCIGRVDDPEMVSAALRLLHDQKVRELELLPAGHASVSTGSQ